MADSCSEIYTALARLEAKIDSIPRVDEQTIISKALAAVFKDNRWIGLLATVALIQSGLNSSLANIGQLEKNFNTKSNLLQDSLNALTGSVQSQFVDLRTKNISILEKLKQVVTKVDSFLEKLTPLFNILNTVGAVAGLASLAGTLSVVFPRLDAHDLELDAIRRQTADAANAAYKGIELGKQANAKADQAIKDANQAIGKADAAIAQANLATGRADAAIAKANLAISKAEATAARLALVEQGVQAGLMILGLEILSTRETLATSIEEYFRLDESQANEIAQLRSAFTGDLAGLRQGLENNFSIDRSQSLEIAGIKNSQTANLDELAKLKLALEAGLNKSNQANNSIQTNIRQNNTKVATIERNQATVTSGVATATATSQQALSNSLRIFQPQIFNQQFTDVPVVRALSAAEARAEIKRTIERDFKFDPRVVKPLTIEEARLEFKRKVDTDFQFDPNVVQPIAVASARTEVQNRFDEIKQSNKTQLEQLGTQFATATQSFQQQLTNLVIAPATAAETTALRQAIATSPVVTQLRTDLDQVVTTQTETTTMNAQANTKLDLIVKKVDIGNANTSKTYQLMGNVQTVVSGISRLVNGFTSKINTMVAQVNASINGINLLIAKLTAFIANVNQQLLRINNFLIAILAISIFLRPLLLKVQADILIILSKIISLGSWLRLDRVWNMLTYAAVLHNAFMLSNSFGQTLLTTTSSFLNAFVISDSENNPIDVQAVLGKQIEETLKSIFGAQTVTYFNNLYKANIRTYQAAANILSSVTSMAYSILTVLEVVGSRISRIGNALRWFGVVADNAFSRMNEIDIFSNPFIVRVTKLEEAASTIDMVSNEVISVKQEATNIKTQKKEFDDSLKATAKLIGKEEVKDDKSVKTPIVNDIDIP